MPDVHDLEREMYAALDRQQEMLDATVEENREFTDEEKKEDAELTAKVESLSKKMERLKALEEKREGFGQSNRMTSPDNDRLVIADRSRREIDISVGNDQICFDPYGGYGPDDGRDVDSYEMARIIGNFGLDVRNAKEGLHPRLARWQRARMTLAAGDGMTTAIGHEGGYLIPTAVGRLILDRALELAVIRPRAFVIPVAGQTTDFPAVDDTSHSGGTVFGGIQAYFTSEESQLTSSKPKFSKVTLVMHKLTCLSYVSGEMLDWSPISVGTWLPEKLAQAKAWKEDDKFVSGSGAAGEPIGLLNADCKVQVAKQTGQAAATIIFENIVKMYARVWDQVGNLVWLANKTTLAQLPKLTAGDGTTATPIFLPNTSAEGAPLQTLFGIPIVFTEHCKALGTAGDLILANLGEYLVGDASGKERSDVNLGLKFDYDQVAYRLIGYTGGVPSWRSAFTPQNGDTLSPIVTLATRS